MSVLNAIKYDNGYLHILDQLLLPGITKYVPVNNVEEGCEVIRRMQVRGAPAIAIVGCLSLASDLLQRDTANQTPEEFTQLVTGKLQSLVDARPTAVNMRNAANEINSLLNDWTADGSTTDEIKQKLISHIEQMQSIDVATNKLIGDHGAKDIIKTAQNNGIESVSVITYCNTGSLATAGYGTALGVIRSLHSSGKLHQAYACETRPYNQGARLTAYELVSEGIPATLICDNMAAWLMKNRQISAIIVGADRIVANGDTANKIGTYQLAILAQHFAVPFYVAAPIVSIDMTIQNGDGIVVEERPHVEMTHINGMRIAAEGIDCWNPAFDVTPSELITGGVVTEKGVVPASKLKLLGI